jgi:hypothetical protein
VTRVELLVGGRRTQTLQNGDYSAIRDEMKREKKQVAPGHPQNAYTITTVDRGPRISDLYDKICQNISR